VSTVFWLSFPVWSTPLAAHTVKTDANVAATFHIEPNHNPKAGEPSQAWFVLTQRGGKLISLEQCDCQLVVRRNTPSSQTSVSLKPPLKAISAEQYQNIPGAEIVFPQPGLYTLELQGSPKTNADFQPFQLSYTVTVGAGKKATNPIPASGQVASSQATPATQSSDTIDSKVWKFAIAIGFFTGLGVAAGARWKSGIKK
jgi:hypothetical protein